MPSPQQSIDGDGVTTSSAEQSPPAKPRQRLGEDQRREQIIRATIAVVADHGYDNASLARIAGRAGISKGLISHYFADKGELMANTFNVTTANIRDTIAAQLDLSAPVPDVIRAAIRRAAALNSTHRSARSTPASWPLPTRARST